MNNNYNYNQQPQQPQQPMYQQPMYQQRPPRQGGGFNVLALLGIILGGIGCLGFFLSWILAFFGIIAFFASIGGAVCGILGVGFAKRSGKGKGFAMAGLIIGLIGAGLGLVGLICNSCFTCSYCDLSDKVGKFYDITFKDVVNYIFA